MDFGMQIKEFASMLGVAEDTVINWEIRRVKPLGKQIKEKANQFLKNPYSKI
jgi:DNA-binding transcriptional regulator YiaG